MDQGQSEVPGLRASGVFLEGRVQWALMANLGWQDHQVQTVKVVHQDPLVLLGTLESLDPRGQLVSMASRASKEFQERLVIVDLRATTGLQGIHMILTFMAMDLLLRMMILCLHPQV